MSKPIRYRKSRICKDLLFQALRYTKSDYLFFQIHSDLLKIDERVDRVLNGRAQFGWTLTESHITIQLNKWGDFEYRLCNQLHRNKDRPAITYRDGTRRWYKYGKIHREGDQPAIIYWYGIRKWYKHGKIHREGDQPAIIFSDGTRKWYKHGEWHREGDQPAVIWPDGTLWWFKDGRRHREGDHPAWIGSNGHQERWIDGKLIK